MSQNKDEGDIKIVFKLHDSKKNMPPDPAGDMVSKVLTEALVILQALFANYRSDIGIDFNGNALFISVVDGIDNAGINNIELTDDDRHIDYTVHFTHKKLGDVIVDIIRELSIAVEGAINQFKYADVLRFSILTETGLFINNHSPCDSHFLLKSLDFCSVVHYSQILMHRHVVPLTEDQLNREYGIGYIVDYPDPKMLGMQVSFEHDRRLLFITFAFKRSGRISRVIHVIKLQIKYSSIQQIFVHYQTNRNSPTLFLRLKHPPIILRNSAVHVIKLHADKPREQKLEHNEEIQRSRSRKKGERCATWDDSDPCLLDDINGSPLLAIHFQDTDVLECSKLLGRLESCLNITIESRRFNVPTDPTFSLYAILQGTKEELRELSKNYSGHINEKYELMFMFEALFCRGGVILAYLINDRYRERFLKRVLHCHFYNKDVTLSVLESIVNTLDEHKEIYGLLELFEKLYKQRMANSGKHNDMERHGYIKIRKVMITPSRMILFPPEMLMSNRVFRYNPTKYPPSSFVRVIFRDEDWSRVHKKNVTFKLVNQFIGERLKSGFEIAGRLFNHVGASNSQLRDAGCVFMNESIQEINKFRQQFGSFSTTSIPKMMARLGQCFTQALESGVDMSQDGIYKMTFDYTGGADRNGSPYIFSDGCGSVGMESARQMAWDLQLPNVPSCFQFRFAGFKGVLQVNPRLRDCNFLFRPSQQKFETRDDAEPKMELVKYSSPVTLSLNKPMINILDQVSGMQNHESHVRICDRINDLLEIHMNNLCEMLTNEGRAREKLSEFTRLIHYDKLDFFNVTEEPFFRQLLMSAAKVSIYKLRKKHHISIPADLGRVMFGVVDDTGILQYGQVFVQYTKNASLHNPAGGAHKIVRKGPIMVSKNPCIVAGDVRIFEAIDVPALRHLNDVIVFPQSGPRPHPDEMAGSDLDGDEYGVIWDEQLMISANEPAFDYTGEKIEVKSTDADAYTEIQDKIADYMVQSIQNEHVGQIANSHLAVSDLYGIQADVCYGIAKKHSQAVDFQKTGHQPSPLLIYWDDDRPPERYERAPDYMEREHEVTYVSNRLNGKLFREIRDMSEFITSAIEDNDAIEAPPLDLFMIHDGIRDKETRNKYMTEAAEHYATYGLAIQRLMENHGLNEGELFSGTFSTLRNKLSDRENDDMSFFNTTRVIKEQLQIIVATARMKFFGGKDRVLEFTKDPPFYNPYMDNNDILSSVCDRVCFDDVPEELKLRASAYYLLCYDTDRKLLSFPWIVWDVLKLVNRELRMAYEDIPLLHNRSDPLGASVSDHITEYIKKQSDDGKNHSEDDEDQSNDGKNQSEDDEDQSDDDKNQSEDDEKQSEDDENQSEYDKNQSEEDEKQNEFQMFLETYACKGTIIGKYVEQHSGLAELMFFCVEWANKFGAFSNNCFEKKHLCLLLILHGLNHFTHNPQHSVGTAYWLNRIDEENTSSVDNTEQPMQHPTQLQDRIGGLGRIFISFLQFLASNEFKKVDTLDFSVCGLEEDSFFCKGEWAPLHNAAERTYHHLVFTGRKDILPATNLESIESNSGLPSFETKVSEQIPFIIEMPHQNRDLFIENECMMTRLCTLTGCTFIKMRLHPDYKLWGSGPPPNWTPRNEGDEWYYKPLRIIVSCGGTRKAYNYLRDLLAVHPNVSLQENRKKRVEMLRNQVVLGIQRQIASMEASTTSEE